MQRYFLDEHSKVNNIVIIRGGDFHHIVRVMRKREGDNIRVIDTLNNEYLGTITKICDESITVSLDELIENLSEMKFDVTIAQGLIKSDKFEYVIQKGTELGAKEFIPLKMKRNIVKLDQSKESKKIVRWEKIAKEASEQCGRVAVPKINRVMSLKELCEIDYNVKLFAYEEIAKNNSTSNLKTVLQNVSKNDKIVIIIGPEGGINEDEASFLEQNGFIGVSLGPRILRTETAPLYFLSAISYEQEL